MSSSRHTRSSQRTPASAASKGKKKARTTEDLPLTPEGYIYRSGLCKNRFTQDFRDRKVIPGRWVDFKWFSENGFDFEELFESQGWGTLVNLKETCYTYLVKLVYANFQFSKSDDADSYVNGKSLDLSSSSLNSLVNAPDDGKKFFENHGWVGLSEVDPLHILRVVLENPTLDEIVRPKASDLSIHRRILHHMVCNIILPRAGKFEYITFLDLFVMYCLITHTPMNLGHLMINHMKAATEKKNQGLPYGMFFTRMFRSLEVDLGGEVREPPVDTRVYNQKTLRLMGFLQNEEGFWVKKADATPQKRSHKGSGSESPSEDEEEDTFTRTPSTATRTPRQPFSPSPFSPMHMDSSSRIPPSHSHEPNFASIEASFGDIKEEQRKLGQQLEQLSLDMKSGFADIKELFAAHDERFKLLDKDVRLLKHQVNNSVRVATDVIQATVNDLKSSAQDVVNATEVSMDVDRNLRPHVMRWTYWFSTTWSNWLRKFDVDHPPPPSF